MSLWSTIGYKVKEIISKMIGARTIEQALHVAPAISSQMEEAIRIWADMYENKAPWLKEPSASDPERVVSLGIPAMIASEKARTALLEFSSDVTAPMKDVEVPNPEFKEPEPDVLGNIIPSAQPPTIVEKQPVGSTERADYLNEQYSRLLWEYEAGEMALDAKSVGFATVVVMHKITSHGVSIEENGQREKILPKGIRNKVTKITKGTYTNHGQSVPQIDIYYKELKKGRK